MKASILFRVLSLALLASAIGSSAQNRTPGVASTVLNPAYPLHLRVLSAQRTSDRFGVQGFGRADLLGPSIQGVDYTFDCEQGFLHNGHSDEFYQGRWKKPDKLMEILVQRIGSDHIDRCDLKVTMKPSPYGRYKASATQPPAPAP
jgi:hypothetical protein